MHQKAISVALVKDESRKFLIFFTRVKSWINIIAHIWNSVVTVFYNDNGAYWSTVDSEYVHAKNCKLFHLHLYLIYFNF